MVNVLSVAFAKSVHWWWVAVSISWLVNHNILGSVPSWRSRFCRVNKTQPLPFCNLHTNLENFINNIKKNFYPQTKITCVVVQWFLIICEVSDGFPCGSAVKNLPSILPQETWVWSLGGEDPVEEGPATHSSILAWRIPWTEEGGGLQSTRLQIVRIDWSDLACSEWYWHTPILKISVWIGDVNLAMNIEIYKLCLYPVILLLSLSHEEIIWDPDTFKPQCWPHYYLCAFSC